MDLDTVYQQWCKNTRIRKIVHDFFGYEVRSFTEVYSSLERLLIAMINERKTNEIFYRLEATNPLRIKFETEVRSKLSFYYSANFIDEFFSNVFELFPQEVVFNDPDNFERTVDPIISYREYQDYFEPQRFHNLLRYINDLNVLAKLCIHYSCLSMGGQQWSIPQSFADDLYLHLEVRGEGFASPFNSKFFGKPDAKYCSIFPEIDYCFGSSGSFFDNELQGNWLINPPFVEDVIYAVALKLERILSESEETRTFIIISPKWTDTAGYKILQNSAYLRAIHEKLPNTYHYVSTLGERKVAKTPTTVFVLSSDDGLNLISVKNVIDRWRR